MGDESKKNIGMVGLGYWGKNILRNLNELGVLRVACDLDPNIVEERKKEYGEVKFTTSFKDILADHEITAVVISSPAATHYELVKLILNADKDVFVEKPLALCVSEAKELIGLARRKNKIIMVGHILHYHPALIKLKEMIDVGELGKIRHIYSNRLNIGKFRTEENILWSFAPHDISAILMLLNEEPCNVQCFGGNYITKGVYDTTLTTLEFRNGVKGHIFVSWLHPYKEQKLIVVGSKAMAVFDDVSKEKLSIYPHKIEYKGGKIPVAQKAQHTVVQLDKVEPLKEEFKHFIDCVRERKTPKTDGYEGLRVLQILEEAEKAMGTSDNVESSNIRQLNYFVHETAEVDKKANIGEGTKIWHYSHVLNDTNIGTNCVVGQNAMIGPNVNVGSGCKIQNNVSVYKGVTLEDSVFCGPSCVFTNVYSPRAFINRKEEFLQTLVKKGATIGANATIVCGTTIGQYALIGAGSVVKRDVPDFALVAGVPAKQIGWVCKCGESLKAFDNAAAQCGRCSNKYKLIDGQLTHVEGL